MSETNRVLNFSEFGKKYSQDSENDIAASYSDFSSSADNFQEAFDEDTYEDGQTGPNRPITSGGEETPAEPSGFNKDEPDNMKAPEYDENEDEEIEDEESDDNVEDEESDEVDESTETDEAGCAAPEPLGAPSVRGGSTRSTDPPHCPRAVTTRRPGRARPRTNHDGLKRKGRLRRRRQGVKL